MFRENDSLLIFIEHDNKRPGLNICLPIGERSISRIRKYLTREATEIAIHALLSLNLISDGNSSFNDLPK